MSRKRPPARGKTSATGKSPGSRVDGSVWRSCGFFFVAQMAARQRNKNVLQRRVPRCQSGEFTTAVLQVVDQGGQGDMRLLDRQAESARVVADGLHAGEPTKMVGRRRLAIGHQREIDDMLAPQPGN